MLRAQIKMKSNWLLFKTQRLAFVDDEELKSLEFLKINRGSKSTNLDEENKQKLPGIS